MNAGSMTSCAKGRVGVSPLATSRSGAARTERAIALSRARRCGVVVRAEDEEEADAEDSCNYFCLAQAMFELTSSLRRWLADAAAALLDEPSSEPSAASMRTCSNAKTSSLPPNA